MLINCDMGESFGKFKIGNDEDLMPYIDVCNIACGMHAGDPLTILNAVKNAVKLNKHIGAHPGYPDIEGFGRRKMSLNAKELNASVVYQISVLYQIVENEGSRLYHVKPHGALYHDAGTHPEIAQSIVDAILYIDPDLKIICQRGSSLYHLAIAKNLTVLEEVFADRRYLYSGKLAPRNLTGSSIINPKEAKEQVSAMLKGVAIKSIDGKSISLTGDTVCIHGDNPASLQIAKTIYSLLKTKT